MRVRWAVAVAAIVVVAGVFGGAVAITRLKSDRDDARSALAVTRQSLAVTTAQLGAVIGLRDVYERDAASRGRTIHELQRQVGYDHDRLVDCWTALVRTVPSARLTAIFGGSLGFLRGIVKSRGALASYVRRCAAVVS